MQPLQFSHADGRSSYTMPPVFSTHPPSGHFDLDYKISPKEAWCCCELHHAHASCRLPFSLVVSGPSSPYPIETIALLREFKKVTSSNQG